MSEENLHVVDEDDLGCLHDYLVAAITGDDISELPRLWNQELGVIRSHPLSEEIRKAREDVLDSFSGFIDAYSRQDEDGHDYVSVLALQNHIEFIREGAP